MRTESQISDLRSQISDQKPKTKAQDQDQSQSPRPRPKPKPKTKDQRPKTKDKRQNQRPTLVYAAFTSRKGSFPRSFISTANPGRSNDWGPSERARSDGPQSLDLPGLAVLMKDLGKRSEEHTSELQSLRHLVCRLLLEKKKKKAA